MKSGPKDQLLTRISGFCAGRDRSVKEVTGKLISWQADPDEISRVIPLLLENRLLDEERFCKAFTESAFKERRWGRLKIRKALESHGIEEKMILQSLEQIDEQEYLEALKVAAASRASGPALYRQLVQRGYEEELILQVMPGDNDKE